MLYSLGAEGEKNSLKDNGKKKEETESQEKNKVSSATFSVMCLQLICYSF